MTEGAHQALLVVLAGVGVGEGLVQVQQGVDAGVRGACASISVMCELRLIGPQAAE